MADFNKIDFATWKRTSRFEHYFKQLRCTYSVTANLDITHLKQRINCDKIKLYPCLIYAVTTIVNQHEEFRISMDDNGNIGTWSSLNPSYTVFHRETETFSEIWSDWDDRFELFLANYNSDLKSYGREESISPKPNMPKNCFPISCLPWISFTGFNLNIFADGSYLLPIFTWGKYFEIIENGNTKIQIPLSIQVHHAVCDGFHVSRFVNELQELLERF